MFSRVTLAVQRVVPGDLELNRPPVCKGQGNRAKMDSWLMRQSAALIAQEDGNSAAERHMMKERTY